MKKSKTDTAPKTKIFTGSFVSNMKEKDGVFKNIVFAILGAAAASAIPYSLIKRNLKKKNNDREK